MKEAAFFGMALAAGLLAGCGQGGDSNGGGGEFPVRVVAEEARRQPVFERLSLIGTLLPNEAVEIRSEMDGLVEEVFFEEGGRLKAGDLLVRLDESKIAAALAQAEANFFLSRTTLDRSRQLYEKQMVSHQEFDQAAANFKVDEATLKLRQRELRDARVVAPFDGVAGVRLVSPGQVIGRNEALARLVDVDPVKVEFNVPERHLGRLKLEQEVAVELAAFPGETFRGAVYFIAPELDAQMRTAAVRARIPNPDGKLRPGMFASLNLTLGVRDDAVVVPESALIPRGETAAVFVVDADSRAQLRPVTPGFRSDGWIEIVEGLDAGERVITEGHQKTRPGGPVLTADPTARAE